MRILLFCLLFISLESVHAQIEGTVRNASSQAPVFGATVSHARSGQTTQTDVAGEFYLEINEVPARLRISAAGFESQSVVVETTGAPILIDLVPVPESLPEVVLQGTLVAREVMQTPASVGVLDSGDLERTDGTNIVQALNTVSGVFVHQGALNTNKIQIRGVGARAQYSSNRVKAYFMGIPVSSAEGETTLDDIDPSVIGRVEVLKGPASGIFGAGLGGVINMYPKHIREAGTFVRSESMLGSFGLYKQTVQLGHSAGATDLMATYNHLESDGYRDNGQYERDSFTLSGQVAGGENSRLFLLGQFTNLKAYIPSSLNEEDFKNDPSTAAFTWAAAKGYESYDKGRLGLSYETEIVENFSNTSTVYTNFRNGYEPRPFNILKEEQVAVGSRTQFDLEFQLFELPSRWIFGAAYYQEWYDSATFENLYESNPGEGSIRGGILSNNTQDRRYYDLFTQWNFSVSEAFSVEAGLNLNSTSYSLTDLHADDEIDQSGSYQFDQVISPRLGAVYSLSQGKNIYATVSHGFSTPTVAETLTPEGMINTDLQAETGMNYEIGFKGNFFDNQLYAEIAAYSIQVENLLVAERVGPDQYIGRNLGKTDHNGLEFLLRHRFDLNNHLRLHSWVNASLNAYTFDEFLEEGQDLSGNDLPAVPDQSAQAGLDLATDYALTLRATYHYEGAMPLNDENSGFTQSYNLLHLKAVWAPKLSERWETEFSAGVNNVFDAHYAASIVPNAVGFGGTTPRYYYPGNPRNYFLGFSLSYIL